MNLPKQLFEVKSSQVNTKYSKKIMAPQYVPKNTSPNIAELYDVKQYSKLIRDISNSKVSDSEKEFLIKAATRHISFRYDKIADYYAHATPEMQNLMEQSALVIIDIDDAIANGYVKVSKTINDIVWGKNDGE